MHDGTLEVTVSISKYRDVGALVYELRWNSTVVVVEVVVLRGKQKMFHLKLRTYKP